MRNKEQFFLKIFNLILKRLSNIEINGIVSFISSNQVSLFKEIGHENNLLGSVNCIFH